MKTRCFQLWFYQVVGKPVMKVPGAFSGGLFLDPPVRDWRAVFDSFFFLTE